VPSPVPRTWDIQADVVVVGFGAAGACAALEAAAAGCDVVVLDRFAGGGATALSGGVIYASTRRPTGVACRWARLATMAAGSGSAFRLAARRRSWTGSRSGASSARRPPC
jgi:succinate dehydrogenase/fumarate reductase flavoprotein subunit